MIGINQRIPIGILELALTAALCGDGTTEYFTSLAETEYKGANRVKKAVSVMNRLTLKNPLWPFIKENASMFEASMKSKNDRPLLFTAVIAGAYEFGYDTLVIAGKYLHAQDEILSAAVRNKLAEKYGANRSLPNALYCVLPMYAEAGLLERPTPGIIKARRQRQASAFAKKLYAHSFFIHNPSLQSGSDYQSNPYFEFIR